MSLRQHLLELRNRLGLAVMFILIGGVFGFIWFALPIGPISPLGDILLEPYCALPDGARFSPNNRCQLFQRQPLEGFMVRFKVGMAAGMVVSAPLWLYQVWSFITPGLHFHERKLALTFVGLASVLFATGAVLAFFVIPQGLDVLVGFGGDVFITALDASDYISFVLTMLLIFGVSFELPLLVIMLNKIGMLPYTNLRRWRRGMTFGLFVFAAFATPGTDPLSMVALAAAMTMLLEIAVQVSRIHDKRRAKRENAEDLSVELGADIPTPLWHTHESAS